MTFAFVRDVPIDEPMYRRVRTLIGDGQPDGLIAHLVIKRDQGLRYIDVWETEDAWEAFRRARVEPAVEKMLAEWGITVANPMQPEFVEVIDAWVGH
jgi:hypothetical protein